MFSLFSLSLSLCHVPTPEKIDLSHIPWPVSLQGPSCCHSPPPSQLWFFLLVISVSLSLTDFPLSHGVVSNRMFWVNICCKICWLLGLLERQKLGFDIWEAKKRRSWKFCWVLIFEKLGFGDFVERLEWKKVDLKENVHGSGYLFWVRYGSVYLIFEKFVFSAYLASNLLEISVDGGGFQLMGRYVCSFGLWPLARKRETWFKLIIKKKLKKIVILHRISGLNASTSMDCGWWRKAYKTNTNSERRSEWTDQTPSDG